MWEAHRTEKLTSKIFGKCITFFSLQWRVFIIEYKIHIIKILELVLWMHAISLCCYSLEWSGRRRLEIWENRHRHFYSQDTYRVRLNNSEEYRLFAASVRERKKKYLWHAQSLGSTGDGALLKQNVWCWRMFLGLPGQRFQRLRSELSDHRENQNQMFTQWKASCSIYIGWYNLQHWTAGP